MSKPDCEWCRPERERKLRRHEAKRNEYGLDTWPRYEPAFYESNYEEKACICSDKPSYCYVQKLTVGLCSVHAPAVREPAPTVGDDDL